ncbi:unnamed protein product [Anisakis simplex]|uniref:DNA-directed RNA polymerase n=1 Tax=Anisakis simplex TaxID=6269 RepID=A0A0M3JX73_ANISI|nr:unnamed protein product [Anisakis simplex]
MHQASSIHQCVLHCRTKILRSQQFLFKRFVTRKVPLISADVASTSDHNDDSTLPKIKTPKSSALSEWEIETVKELSYELRHSRLNFSAEMNKKAAQSQLIRYAINEEYSSMISYVMQFLEAVSMNSTQYRGDDQFFSIALLLSARGMRSYSTNIRSADSGDAISLFYTIATLLERLPILGSNTRMAWLILLNRIEKWADLRSIDQRSSDIDRIILDLQRTISKKVYGCNFRFVQDEYMKKFYEQLSMESTHCLRVRNFCRVSNEISAEKLIDGWNWRSAIERTLQQHLKQLRQYPCEHPIHSFIDASLKECIAVKGYLDVLDPSEVASSVMTSVLSMCGLGQHLIVYSQFEYSLAEPVLEIIHRKFITKFIDEPEKLCEELFAEYIRYLLEPDLSRRFTLREWWMQCCENARVDPFLQFPFVNFHAETRRQLGSFLLNVVIEACTFPNDSSSSQGESRHSPSVKDQTARAFGIRNVVLEEESIYSEDGKMNLSKMVALNTRMLDLLNKHQFESLLFPTYNLPMKIPPRPWIDYGNGGPSYTKSSDVLRNLPDYPRTVISDEVRRRIRKKSQARPVFDALNDLGATPWRINGAMLDIILEFFKMSPDPSKADMLHRLAIPSRSDTVKVPDFVETFGDNVRVEQIPSEKWREYSKNKYESIKKRNELNSLWYWLMYRLVMAEHFRKDVLFFAHNMDFRGRVYPISPYLSHMGDDINRSLLRFAEGKQLGADGFKWLKLHCVNLTGHMKRESIASRFDYVDKILPKIIDSANNPINGERWWMDSDEPWQTLAACIEIRDALNSGDATTFVSYLPIHQDGSCNGLQHYAALGRDRQGGAEVNLLPSQLPADVYSSVAKRVEEKRLEDEKSEDENIREFAIALRKALPDTVPRKVIKQTVMTTVYGVTMYGGTQQIKRQLKALEIDDEQLGRFSSYLARKTFASLHDAFTSSMQLKDWFRRCAKSIVDLMRPVEWETPLGLPVMQPYLKLKKKHNKLCLMPVMMKQVNAFPPNFVHSLDSTHMMLTTLHCRRLGITFAAVHDCYWTHACNVDRMNVLCRLQFIHLHQQPLVQQCAKFFVEKYLPRRRRKEMSADELARFTRVFTPSVKAGQLNIEDVRESVYFFS